MRGCRCCFAAITALLVASCGGGSTSPAPPEDSTLRRATRAALTALEMDQPEEAARLYAAALARARERDDAAAIADAGFGQATAALAHGDARGALEIAQEVRSELARRGRRAPTALMLAEATALHRLRRTSEADALAAEVVARRTEDPEAALRAAFLRGLIAADRRDLRGLAAARAAIGEPGAAAFRADAAELDAWAALLRGQLDRAQVQAANAAALRQEALDYRGLSRALALQGTAARRADDLAAAADLMLRAGRGAAARGETLDAERWLREARELAARAGAKGTGAAARAALAALLRR